ncbi:MAG: polyamine ABC transporter permease [Rhizobiales bacterium 65-79]|jgi:putative spermidine/putrescine transport system permease protein|nr:ABC transporter permease [Hyphomicrobiales bacterium]OJU04393.1 MAG: polyamine ABC transporter permease [Rhizobiales bacterium 65-79]
MEASAKTLTERVSRLLLAVFATLVFIFLIAPILAILPLSFNDSTFLVYPMHGFTLHWYGDVFASEKWRLAVQNSFLIGIPAAAIATALGTLAAIGLSLADFRGKAIVTALLLSPLVVPIIIVAVGLYFFFAPLGLTQTYAGLIMAHAALGAPFVVVTVSSALASFDRNLARAAASLGAPPVTVFRRVMLPLVRPGVISGALFAFAVSFDEVVTILLLAAPQQRTIPREMFDGMRDSLNPSITAVAAMLVTLAILLLLVVEWLRVRNERLRKAKVD